MHPITAIIPTYNEADNIVDAIKSVSWADEIIVVDSFSADNTVELARPLSTRILQREYINSASQKNWAIPQAKHEWVFIHDADERVTPALRDEIKELLDMPEIRYDAFWIRRQNWFMGKRVRFSGWRRDKVIRLFRRDKCRYEEKHVHAEITTGGRIGRLRGKINHNTYKSIEHFKSKMERYAEWSARDALRRGVKPNAFHFYIKPAFRFFKHFIWQLGFLDGRRGWVIANMYAWYVRQRYRVMGHL